MDKILLCIIWIYGLVATVVPSLPLARYFVIGVWVMLGAHVLELAYFRRHIIHAPGSTVGHVIQVLIFGVLHARTLEDPKRT